MYKKITPSLYCPWYLKISSGSEMFNCEKRKKENCAHCDQGEEAWCGMFMWEKKTLTKTCEWVSERNIVMMDECFPTIMCLAEEFKKKNIPAYPMQFQDFQGCSLSLLHICWLHRARCSWRCGLMNTSVQSWTTCPRTEWLSSKSSEGWLIGWLVSGRVSWLVG